MKKIIYLIYIALLCMHSLSYAMLPADQFAAAVCLQDLSTVQQLIDAGFCVNPRMMGSMTPLMLAARFKSAEIVNLLLKSRADVKMRDEKGWTALVHAIRYGYPQIVYLLLQPGTDVNIQDKDGWTPLMYALFYNYYEEVIDQLLQAGADIYLHNNEIHTALELASRTERPKVVQLLTQIADLDQKAAALIDKLAGQHDQKNISANNFSILDLIKYYRPILVKCLNWGIIKENHHKKLILDKAIVHNDVAMLKALIASEYQIPKIILQKTMRLDIKGFLERHLARIETLYLLRSVHEEKPQNTLGLMPKELMRYLVSWLAIDERPASNA